MTSEDTPHAVRALITGKVQGVWFRAWTAQEAEKRGLTGWVRNRRDGSVEALLCGPQAALDDMLAAVKEANDSSRKQAIR